MPPLVPPPRSAMAGSDTKGGYRKLCVGCPTVELLLAVGVAQPAAHGSQQ